MVGGVVEKTFSAQWAAQGQAFIRPRTVPVSLWPANQQKRWRPCLARDLDERPACRGIDPEDFAPSMRGNQQTRRVLEAQMTTPNFPLTLSDAGARVSFAQLKSERMKIGDVLVESFPLNHPQGAYGYRIESGGKSIVYATDLEHGDGNLDPVLRDYAAGADVLIYDAQYNDEEYASHRGWGHSTWREATSVARDADVGKLFLFHFDPSHTDSRVAESERLAMAEFDEASAAREGLVVLV